MRNSPFTARRDVDSLLPCVPFVTGYSFCNVFLSASVCCRNEASSDTVKPMTDKIKRSIRGDDILPFRHLLEQSSLPFYVVNPAEGFRLVFANGSACRHFGRSREELLSMHLPDLAPLFTLKKCEETVARLRVKKGVSMEMLHTSEGRAVMVELWADLIHFQGEELLACWFHDISKRQKREDALRQSERQFRHLAEALPQLVWIAAPDGSIQYCNARCHEYSGLPSEELRDDLWIRLLHPDDLQKTVDRWQYSVRTGESYEIEYRLRRGSDGAYRWFLSRAIPVRGDTGEILRWFGTSTDIEPQKQSEEELRRVMDELTRSNRELEQFAYIASHDLQKPLRKVTGYVQILRRKYRGRLDEKADTYIGYASDGALRMQQLINDLLAFSRIGRSSTFLPVDLNAAFAAAVADLADEIEKSGAEVTSDVLPTVTGDRDQLDLLLKHLIGNALKYRDPDKPPRIHVAAHKTDGEWEFSVRDNGIGIEPRFFGKIFLIFQRLHSREYPGTGIGLATVKKIIERHHGRVWVESHPGEGSTFYFSLPSDAVDHAAMPTPPMRKRPKP